VSSAVARLEVGPGSRLFKALGDPTRLRVVALLTHGELCVCHIEAALGLPQPTVSRHLAVLRNGGVVATRREGTWVYYRLAPQLDAVVKGQLRALVSVFGGRADLRADVKRLLQSQGPGACK
jgi:ArsR family transcriptional regulator, arsenate/arsenite/antimonite-responsive transcriptional repressor